MQHISPITSPMKFVNAIGIALLAILATMVAKAHAFSILSKSPSLLSSCSSCSFVALRTGHSHGSSRRPSSTTTGWSMKDHSASSAFDVGSSVQVVEDVFKAGVNLLGRRGQVLENWEKCDVDPTCCCAEQVNPDMAVRVEFPGNE